MNKNTVTKMAFEMTIMDAIEKGNINPAELAEYMKSETFEKSVDRYKKIIYNEFNNPPVDMPV